MRSEIFPEIPVKSRHCANVETVDNVDKMIKAQAMEGGKSRRYQKNHDWWKMFKN